MLKLIETVTLTRGTGPMSWTTSLGEPAMKVINTHHIRCVEVAKSMLLEGPHVGIRMDGEDQPLIVKGEAEEVLTFLNGPDLRWPRKKETEQELEQRLEALPALQGVKVTALEDTITLVGANAGQRNHAMVAAGLAWSGHRWVMTD